MSSLLGSNPDWSSFVAKFAKLDLLCAREKEASNVICIGHEFVEFCCYHNDDGDDDDDDDDSNG